LRAWLSPSTVTGKGAAIHLDGYTKSRARLVEEEDGGGAGGEVARGEEDGGGTGGEVVGGEEDGVEIIFLKRWRQDLW